MITPLVSLAMIEIIGVYIGRNMRIVRAYPILSVILSFFATWYFISPVNGDIRSDIITPLIMILVIIAMTWVLYFSNDNILT